MQMRIIQWDFDAWEDYIYWQAQDKKGLFMRLKMVW